MRVAELTVRALQLARRRALETAGLPEPIAGIEGISRRHLLKGLGASAAAIGATGLAPPPGPVGRVAIIGGGLAGLNALRLLTKAGVDARLYEARKRLGGRVHTQVEASGITNEIGGQFINGDHADMLELTKLYNLDLFDRRSLTGHADVVRDGQLLLADRLATELAPIAAQIAADSARLDADHDAVAPAIDALSAAQYLDRHRALIGSPAARALLDQTIRTEYGVEPIASSALQLIFNLPTVNGQAYELLANSDERFVIKGGSERVIDALAKGHGGRIRTNCALVAMSRQPGGILLRFADGSHAVADRVILTLPASLLGSIDHGGLFPAPWRAFAAEVRQGANEKLNAAYAARAWEVRFGLAGGLWNANPQSSFSEVWDATLGQPSQAGILTWFLGGDQCLVLDKAALRSRIEAEAAGGAGVLGPAASALLTNWSRQAYTRGAYVNFRPGQTTRFASLLWVEEDGATKQKAEAGSLLFAGEHLSDAFPGYMNGAAQTGRLAAAAILAGARA